MFCRNITLQLKNTAKIFVEVSKSEWSKYPKSSQRFHIEPFDLQGGEDRWEEADKKEKKNVVLLQVFVLQKPRQRLSCGSGNNSYIIFQKIVIWQF